MSSLTQSRYWPRCLLLDLSTRPRSFDAVLVDWGLTLPDTGVSAHGLDLSAPADEQRRRDRPSEQ